MKKLQRLQVIFFLLLILTLSAAVPVFAAGLNVKVLTLTEGAQYQLKVSGAKKVSWKSRNKKIASVSKKGKVKAVKAGKTIITAKAGKKTYKCTVKVQAKITVPVPVKQTAPAETVTKTVVRTNQSPALTVQSLGAGLPADEKTVLSKILAMKKKYPEGRRFTNETFYAWNGGIYRGGYGCAAFVFELSDEAFGMNETLMHYNWNDIHVGDILRTDFDTHSVIVLKTDDSGVIVAEGNYNDSVHWGRKISLSELRSSGSNSMTRYDTESYSLEEVAKRALKLPVLYDYK